MMFKCLVACMLVFHLYSTLASSTPLIFQKMANKGQQRWCGRIDMVLGLICQRFPEPSKRSYRNYLQSLKKIEDLSSEDSYNNGYPFISKLDDNSILQQKYKKDGSEGIYNECCVNPCSLKYMQDNYCYND